MPVSAYAPQPKDNRSWWDKWGAPIIGALGSIGATALGTAIGGVPGAAAGSAIDGALDAGLGATQKQAMQGGMSGGGGNKAELPSAPMPQATMPQPVNPIPVKPVMNNEVPVARQPGAANMGQPQQTNSMKRRYDRMNPAPRY